MQIAQRLLILGFALALNANCGGKTGTASSSGAGAANAGGTLSTSIGGTATLSTYTTIGGSVAAGAKSTGGTVAAGAKSTGGTVARAGSSSMGATASGGTSNPSSTTCTPVTCLDKGANCGYIFDPCEALLYYCGDCPTGQECGVVAENVCGYPLSGPCADPTSGFCPQLADCTMQYPTSLSGMVLAPAGLLPVFGALVYIPNGSSTYPYGVEPFNDGVAAASPTWRGSSTWIASTITAIDGTFTLSEVPAGKDIPIVVELGRWRRLVTLPYVAPCQATQIDKNSTRLPSRQGMGSTLDSIPLMALSTGAEDALECLLRKMGIEDSQFSNAGGSGRIRFYRDNGATCTDGAGSCSGQTPNYTQLLNSQAEIEKYDALLFPCDGHAHDVDVTAKKAILDLASNPNAYVNKGGRALFTHYSYAFLYNQPPASNLPWLSSTNASAVDGPHHPEVQTLQIDITSPLINCYSQWLGLPSVNALAATNPPRMAIENSNENLANPPTWNDSPLPLPALRWGFYFSNSPAASIQQISFDTPWNLQPEQQVGRVSFSSFHVPTSAIAGAACAQSPDGGTLSTGNCSFPAECNGEFTSQEKALAYMLFDLLQNRTPPPFKCKPRTCSELSNGARCFCGLQNNGCGGVVDCGSCCCPSTCDEICADPAENCSAVLDSTHLLLCPKFDGCASTVACYCKLG